uniref:Putative lectin/glucanase superfamily protein n=1 Tax=viral metagenome TaxID=1070528 RepID=A0A6H1ZTA9_9ZZZZ
MPEGLVLPGRRAPAPEPPERIALDMAFGAGNPAVLGDKSRYNSHGAITTATVAAGLHGLCLDFNPLNPDYITIPAAHTQLDFTTEDFSIVARVYVDNTGAHRYLLSRGLWNTDGYYFRVSNGGELLFRTFQVAANQASNSPAGSILINNWYTVGMSRSGPNVAVYRNGVDITTVWGVHINPVTCARDAYVGLESLPANGPYDGRIEFYRIFVGIELTGSEHLAWHNALV